MDLGGQTLAALGGAAIGGQVAAMIPVTDTPGSPPIIEWGKNTLLALGLKIFGGKLLPAKYIDAAALGIMMGPTKRLVIGFVPEAATYLGDVVALPSFPGSHRQLMAYSQNGMSAYDSEETVVEEQLGSYSDGW